MRRHSGFMAAAAPLAIIALCAAAWAGGEPPVAYKRCKKCHGAPGDGGTKAAPDLAASSMTFEQFKTQVANGSKWKGKPPKKSKYRWKKMPRQLQLTENEVRTIYDYVRSTRTNAQR